ncbi:MAG: 3-dehydroquinate dehydratase-2 [Marivirga sp.]|jgi:3-dehydroquinate dehydratase-2
MKVLIINGPNLNMLGKREPNIYGIQSFEEILAEIHAENPKIQIDYYQSNIEGELVSKLQEADPNYDGILLNAGAYTHTSIAIHDAIAAIKTPVLEIHISNIYKREEFRHKSIISSQCIGMIAGLGIKGYKLGVSYFKN